MTTKRVTVNLPEETVALLKEMKFRKDVNYTDAIRRGVTMFKLAMDNQDDGGKVQFLDKKGKVVMEPKIL